jgi:hypothetical protein
MLNHVLCFIRISAWMMVMIYMLHGAKTMHLDNDGNHSSILDTTSCNFIMRIRFNKCNFLEHACQIEVDIICMQSCLLHSITSHPPHNIVHHYYRGIPWPQLPKKWFVTSHFHHHCNCYTKANLLLFLIWPSLNDRRNGKCISPNKKLWQY